MVPGSERVLIEDWCQQFPSHSTGDLAFGPDGALYASAGDGASFNYVDHGQTGNPCGDPMGGTGTLDNEGGALRAQDIRTTGDPTGLDGTVIRIEPGTLANLPSGAPALTSNASRIVAAGMRNPFRLTVRPGTDEVWLGDVGWGTWEEIDRIQPGAPVENFGWPCYEGTSTPYTGFSLCMGMTPIHVPPRYAYRHGGDMVAAAGPDAQPAGRCPNGGSAIAGLAFASSAGDLPDRYDGALFFADNTRGCIAAMLAGTDGLPDPARTELLATGATGVVDLKVGPDRNLYWADLFGGVHRVEYAVGNRAPTARIVATPTSGVAPLQVSFDGTGSTDPDPGDAIASYAWDLDGDGAYDDSTASSPAFTYTEAGTYIARLRVTDGHGLPSAPATVTITAGNSPPVPTIDTPAPTLRWKVGDPIQFSGHATDQQDGDLAAARLQWSLVLHHCATATDCHQHPIQTFDGVAGGAFSAPDHQYPAWLELRLEATDSDGLSATRTVRVDPRTVNLTFASNPSGLQLSVGDTASTTTFARTVIVGSTNSLAAPLSQTLGGAAYGFQSWSDGGAAQHDIAAPAVATTYTATYAATTCAAGQYRAEYFPNQTLSGAPRTVRCEAAIDNNWGSGSPAGTGVGPDRFSARWRQTRSFTSGRYRFTATADDGVRVWVDNTLLIDRWRDQSATSYSANRTLSGGSHVIRMEYYENGGLAVARLSFRRL
jgi:PKD repeat protein/glucose/arabinose dehydrogenase